ncbi:MAG: hypothetical protein Q4A74_02980 [Cardiobacteriaceae bacterium]|nr:hypothetical protein [Cardiobacteriaceae bacterium]
MGKKIFSFLREQFFRLNEKQRGHISKLCHLLGLTSALPIVSKLLSKGHHSDDSQALLWLFYAIVFEVGALYALSDKEGE